MREQIAEKEGIPLIIEAMRAWGASGGVQCNGCLAIVSLVRAESPVCQVSAGRPTPSPALPG